MNKTGKKIVEIIYGLSLLAVVVIGFALLTFAFSGNLPDYVNQSIIVFVVAVAILFWTREHIKHKN